MELFTYTLLTLFPENIPHSSEIHTETLKFLHNVSHAVLISNNLALWENFQFPFLVSLKNFDHPVEQFTPAYIVDLRDRKLNYSEMATWPRDANTRFVFIITEEEKTAYFCNALFIMITETNLKVSVSIDHCKGIGSNSAIGHNCTVNVSFLNLPPNVIFNGEELDGTEGAMLQATADHLGLKLNYTIRPETNWGSFNPPSGLQGDIASGRTLVSFGGLYGFVERAKYADFVYGEVVAVLSWAVPVGIGPRQPTWYIILVTELSPSVWALTLFTYALLTPIAQKFFKENSHSSVAMNILGLILGNPQKLIFKRILSINILVFGFLLTSYYRTMMSTKLTVPAKTPSIHTTKELVESGLELYGPRTAVSYVWDTAKAFPEDAAKYAVAEKYQPSDLPVAQLLVNIAEDMNIAYLRHDDYVYYLAQKDPRTAGRIHIVEQPFTYYNCITMIQKHSCLTSRIQSTYQSLREAGLSTKWIKDLTTHRKIRNSKTPRKLALEHVKGMLFLLLFGWIASIVTFLAEQAYFHGSARKRRNNRTELGQVHDITTQL